MACTIDFQTLNEGFGDKCEEEAIALDMSGVDGASMEFDKTVAAPAKRWAVSSVENQNKSIFGNTTYDAVIARRIPRRNCK